MEKSEFSTIYLLEELAAATDSEFSLEDQMAVVYWNKNIATGTTRTYGVLPNVYSIVHDVTYHEDFEIVENQPLDFVNVVLCQHGRMRHKFKNEPGFTDIASNQNAVVICKKDDENRIILPKEVHIKLNAFYIVVCNQESQGQNRFFSSKMHSFFAMNDIDSSYRYIGPLGSNAKNLTNILYEHTQPSIIDRLRIQGALHQLLADQLEAFAQHGTIIDYKDALTLEEQLKIIELSEHISKNLHLQQRIHDFVEKTGLNPKKLQKGFNTCFGESVNEYINSTRMMQARSLIENTDLSIDDIRAQVGLNSPSYFKRKFFECYAVSPKKHRKVFKNLSPIFSLTYISTKCENVHKDEIFDIVKSARTNNKKEVITGCLLHIKNKFVQTLEGQKSSVMKIFASIEKDSRHKDILVLEQKFTKERLMKYWSMAFINQNTYHNLDTQNIHLDDELNKMIRSYTYAPNAIHNFWKNIEKHMRNVDHTVRVDKKDVDNQPRN